MTKNFEQFKEKSADFLAQTLAEFSDINLDEEIKKHHLQQLLTCLNIQTGGVVYGDIRLINNISDKDKILVFDIANYFASSNQFNAENLSEVKEKFSKFSNSIPPYELSKHIHRCTLADKDRIEQFLEDEKIKIPDRQRETYDKYFKESSKSLMKKITNFLVQCENLQPALENYCQESRELCERLGSGEKLDFIQTVIAGSKIAIAAKPSQSPAAASSASLAAEERSTAQTK